MHTVAQLKDFLWMLAAPNWPRAYKVFKCKHQEPSKSKPKKNTCMSQARELITLKKNKQNLAEACVWLTQKQGTIFQATQARGCEVDGFW